MQIVANARGLGASSVQRRRGEKGPKRGVSAQGTGIEEPKYLFQWETGRGGKGQSEPEGEEALTKGESMTCKKGGG